MVNFLQSVRVLVGLVTFVISVLISFDAPQAPCCLGLGVAW